MSPILLSFCVLSFIYSIDGLRPRINNGKITSSNDFKHVVGIKLDTVLSEYYCTGGIIHEKYVLSAAHCFTKEMEKNPSGGHYYEYKKFTVHVYANTDSMKTISKNAIKRTGTDVYFTKEFLENGIDDIALLKLDQGLDVGGNVLKFAQLNTDYSNRYAVIAGYGEDPEGDKINKQAKRSLKTMDVKIVNSLSCAKIYPPTGVPVIAEKQLCTQAVEQIHRDKRPNHALGTCEGDSGSPILYQGNIVIGVVSRGFDCDSRDHPELHIRVSNYMAFINTVINEQPINANNIAHYTIKNSIF